MCLRRLEMEPDVLSKSSAADIAKLKQKRPTAYSMELHDWVRNQQDKHFFGDMLNSEMAMSRINFGIPLLLAELHELGVEPER